MKIFNFTTRIIILLIFCSWLKGISQSSKNNPDHIYKVVEELPSIKGCETEKDYQKQAKCNQEKIGSFLYENLQYPDIAYNNGVQGTVVIRFIVEKDGSVSHAEIVRDIGAGCGKAAQTLTEKMPKWIPGKLAGKPVRVQYTLPIKFDLSHEKDRRENTDRQVPPPPGPEDLEIFKDIMKHPIFPGCDDFLEEDERIKCADEKIYGILYQNIKYPALAKENNIQGVVEIEFLIEKDGSISEPKVVKGIGGGCDEAALKAVKNLPKFNPGSARGRAYRYPKKIEINFSLDGLR